MRRKSTRAVLIALGALAAAALVLAGSSHDADAAKTANKTANRGAASSGKKTGAQPRPTVTRPRVPTVGEYSDCPVLGRWAGRRCRR